MIPALLLLSGLDARAMDVDLALARDNFAGGCPTPATSFAALAVARTSQPGLFGTTVQPPIGRLPAEFEPRSELHLVYTPGEHDMLVRTVVRESVKEGRVVVHLFEETDRKKLLMLLGVGGRIPIPENLVVSTEIPLDSVWIRDFAPFWILGADGVPQAVDPRYAHSCVDSDAFGSRLANTRALPAHRPRIYLDGGDLLPDGNGRCYTTTAVVRRNRSTEEDVSRELALHLSCRETIFLEPMSGEVVEHVDMFLHVAPGGQLLLARITEDDIANRATMENNEAILRLLPDVSIHWVDMPRDGFAEDGTRYIRSHLNLTVFNNVVLVPVYEDARGETALDQIAAVYPNHRIVPVRSDTAAQFLGAVHCMTTTVP